MQPKLYVEVEFFSSEEGRRSSPIFLTDYPGYRPHFRMAEVAFVFKVGIEVREVL